MKCVYSNSISSRTNARGSIQRTEFAHVVRHNAERRTTGGKQAAVRKVRDIERIQRIARFIQLQATQTRQLLSLQAFTQYRHTRLIHFQEIFPHQSLTLNDFGKIYDPIM